MLKKGVTWLKLHLLLYITVFTLLLIVLKYVGIHALDVVLMTSHLALCMVHEDGETLSEEFGIAHSVLQNEE